MGVAAWSTGRVWVFQVMTSCRFLLIQRTTIGFLNVSELIAKKMKPVILVNGDTVLPPEWLLSRHYKKSTQTSNCLFEKPQTFPKVRVIDSEF